jgi:hypothetical protein
VFRRFVAARALDNFVRRKRGTSAPLPGNGFPREFQLWEYMSYPLRKAPEERNIESVAVRVRVTARHPEEGTRVRSLGADTAASVVLKADRCP